MLVELYGWEGSILSFETLHASAQTRIAQLSTTAKQWSTQTGASLRSVAASHFGPQGEAPSSTLHEIVATRAASSGSQAASAEPGSSSGQGNASRGGIGAELEADQELEAYLRVGVRSFAGQCPGH